MIISANVRNNRGGGLRSKRNAFLLEASLAQEQQLLSHAGRQIEEVAFSLAERISAEKTGELMEIAARIQKFRIAV